MRVGNGSLHDFIVSLILRLGLWLHCRSKRTRERKRRSGPATTAAGLNAQTGGEGTDLKGWF
jgi:hypothetical protein